MCIRDSTSYDPLLEAYVGSRVVMEVVEEEDVHEHMGLLKEYSAEFLEVMDVYFPLPQQVKLTGEASHTIADRVKVALEGRQLHITNAGDQPVYVERITVGDRDKELSAILGGQETMVLHVDNIEVESTLHLRVASRLDMIVPRSHALIRHRAERYDPDTIFDVGLSLVRRDDEEKEIERLRQVLRYSPHDVLSAAKLGELLYRQGELQEAQRWLRKANERAQLLPDNGNRVAQNLRAVERRLDQMRMQIKLSEELGLGRATSDGRDPGRELDFQI
jgi:tetratricopeptide (TPR) repeat protein